MAGFSYACPFLWLMPNQCCKILKSLKIIYWICLFFAPSGKTCDANYLHVEQQLHVGGSKLQNVILIGSCSPKLTWVEIWHQTCNLTHLKIHYLLHVNEHPRKKCVLEILNIKRKTLEIFGLCSVWGAKLTMINQDIYFWKLISAIKFVSWLRKNIIADLWNWSFLW